MFKKFSLFVLSIIVSFNAFAQTNTGVLVDRLALQSGTCITYKRVADTVEKRLHANMNYAECMNMQSSFDKVLWDSITDVRVLADGKGCKDRSCDKNDCPQPCTCAFGPCY